MLHCKAAVQRLLIDHSYMVHHLWITQQQCRARRRTMVDWSAHWELLEAHTASQVASHRPWTTCLTARQHLQQSWPTCRTQCMQCLLHNCAERRKQRAIALRTLEFKEPKQLHKIVKRGEPLTRNAKARLQEPIWVRATTLWGPIRPMEACKLMRIRKVELLKQLWLEAAHLQKRTIITAQSTSLLRKSSNTSPTCLYSLSTRTLQKTSAKRLAQMSFQPPRHQSFKARTWTGRKQPLWKARE